ncbi:hypothetical protein CISG_03945 [Coccidioides immitis RMSCC 3703]|uniref:PEX14-like helix-turn-helix domain-containing protein n=1 Tax=Coccidioides immitis RMSCC 3703 TaxID=454286 RepID=A0A0J8TJQ7_COCIT|nr:hypothetical protein CISG_03945 [Coccidioides immitis RMSCC 3703]
MASPSQQANGTSSIDPYQQLHSYSFTEDPEFKLGLAVILRQPGTPATDEQVNRTDDLVMKSQMFLLLQTSSNTRPGYKRTPASLNLNPNPSPSPKTNSSPRSHHSPRQRAPVPQPPTTTTTNNNDDDNDSSNTCK